MAEQPVSLLSPGCTGIKAQRIDVRTRAPTGHWRAVVLMQPTASGFQHGLAKPRHPPERVWGQLYETRCCEYGGVASYFRDRGHRLVRYELEHKMLFVCKRTHLADQ